MSASRPETVSLLFANVAKIIHRVALKSPIHSRRSAVLETRIGLKSPFDNQRHMYELANRELIYCRTSKSSFIASNPGRFNAVGSMQLGDGLGEIVSYSPLCQSKRTGEFGGGFAVPARRRIKRSR
jgi:hypothetical protein